MCDPPPKRFADDNGNVTLSRNLTVKENLTVNGTSTFKGAVNAGDINVNGLPILSSISHTFTLDNPSYVVPQNILVNEHFFTVAERSLAGVVTVPLPFTGQTGDLATPRVVDNMLLAVQNTAEVGPWYFQELADPYRLPEDPVGTTALVFGYPEIYSNDGGEGTQPPFDRTIGSLNLTLALPAQIATMVLELRWSSESGYDFIRVTKNSELLFSGSGYGDSAADPYLGATLPVIMSQGDTINISFSKDDIVYQGVDNIYFYIRDLEYSTVLAAQVLFSVIRDNVRIFDFGYELNFNDVPTGEAMEVLKRLHLKKNDVLRLVARRPPYAVFDVDYIGTL